MAFSFSNTGSGAAGANVKDGPELQEIQTNELGFAALNGESKVQLLPKPWPPEDLPPPSSSLLSVASSRGLLAAAGPDAVYITSTEKVRDAFSSPPPEKGQTRPFTPEIHLPFPRSSHVAFSSDESVLVVAPSTGGIVAFQVEKLQRGQLDPALQIHTNGQTLRALVPNPVPDSAELFAIITTNGDLMLLDLKAGNIKPGSNGNVLRSKVSCLSWSNRGKQLVAGTADGTAVQMRPDGTVVADIPKSTSIAAESHVSGISWLENDTFFIIYTPDVTTEGIQPSNYYIVQREPKSTNYVFQKLPEVLLPFGVERLPSFHFISRLRNFPPHIQDLLLVTVTTSTDIGIVSRSDKALSQDEPVTGAFAVTMIEEDARRAQLPLSSNMNDTSPIGMVVDLSSSSKVANPIPSDTEIEETDGPVPCLFVLNNEGVLVAWWVIYNESVRQKTLFSGFMSVQAAKEEPGLVAQPSSPAPVSATSSFGTPSTSNAFAKPPGSNAGMQPAQSSFGAPPTKPFGAPTPIASDKPSWASTGFGSTSNTTSAPTFGQPSFNSATSTGASQTPAFGSASSLGSRTTAFGQPSAIGAGGFGKPSAMASAPAFGQASAFGASSTASPFAKAGTTPASSGFASFSKGGGFASFAGGATGQQSPFGNASGTSNPTQQSAGSKTQASPFASQNPRDTFSSFGHGNSTQASPFAAKGPTDTSGALGASNTFKLQSSFKGDGSAKDDLPPPKDSQGFSFGSSFGDMLGESKSTVSPAHDREEDMGEGAPSESDSEKAPDSSFRGFSPQASSKPPPTLVTPPSTLTQSKATPAPPVSSIFSQPTQETTTPEPRNTSGWSFNAIPSTTPKETPNPSHLAMFGTKTPAQETPAVVQKSEAVPTFEPVDPAPRIKEEPPSDDEAVDVREVPEAPLPPDPISKPRYASGDTSASSNLSKAPLDDAPLPPDFLPVPRASQGDEAEQELPGQEEDEFSSGFEEEGDDGASEEDLAEEQPEQLQTSPESSFKSGDRSQETSPTGGLFTKVTSTSNVSKSTRPLFGEVGAAPIFAPPKPQESPRSPSPVRQTFSSGALRADPSRSVSAPAHPRSIIDQRKGEYQKSALAAQAARAREEEAMREQARREAAAREMAQAEADQLANLEDDEDEILRQELERPISPSETLDDFIPIQPKPHEETSKTGVPAQIERLYSDINSMVYTLGINCRSLTAFMQYQQPNATNQSWPGVLKSSTPIDALNDELLLADIARLHEGQAVLSNMLSDCDLKEYLEKSGETQAAVKKEVFALRNQLMSVRKTLHNLSMSENVAAMPLSAEQLSVQHDLRRAFASVQTKMVQVEDVITVLRAKLAESSARGQGVPGRSRKKPTVEAVTKTVGKLMSMAEEKSANIDVLEAQLEKLNVSSGASLLSNGNASGNSVDVTTPSRGRRSMNGGTPGSTGSVYHTPDSRFGGSARSSRGFRTSQNGGMAVVPAEDKQRWQAKAQHRKQVASMLKEVLEEKREGKGKATPR